jgi:hypothetical protein
MASPWPIVVEAGAVGTLPTVSFLANRSPDIFVEPRGSMPDDTFKNLGAPYRIGGRLLVAPSVEGSTSTLTVEGGVSGLQGYGCGPADNDGSVLIVPDSGRPTSAFIQNSTIRNGGGDTGLLLGWRSDMSGPDFINTNTFERLPACQVSRWSNDTGAECPGSTNGSPVCLL